MRNSIKYHIVSFVIRLLIFVPHYSYMRMFKRTKSLSMSVKTVGYGIKLWLACMC